MSLGAFVRYFQPDSPTVPRVAIVTATHAEDPDIPDDGTVALVIFNPSDVQVCTRVAYSATPQPGCWSWPNGAP